MDYDIVAYAPKLDTQMLVHPIGDVPPGDRWGLGRRDLLRIADWDLRMLYATTG
jgi:hypothetical protein